MELHIVKATVKSSYETLEAGAGQFILMLPSSGDDPRHVSNHENEPKFFQLNGPSTLNLAQAQGKTPCVWKSGILVEAAVHQHPVDLRVVPCEGHAVGGTHVLLCQGVGLPVKPPTTNTVEQMYLL